jgi:predicted amidophosphoribosyltransferase
MNVGFGELIVCTMILLIVLLPPLAIGIFVAFNRSRGTACKQCRKTYPRSEARCPHCGSAR